MSDTSTSRKSTRGFVLFGISVVVVILMIVGGPIAGDVLFIAAVAVLPVGAVYGLICRVLLGRLRRRAAADVALSDLTVTDGPVPSPTGAHFEQSIQRNDRAFTIGLLVVTVLEALSLIAVAIVTAIEGPHSVDNNTTALGNAQGAFGTFALLFAVVLLCAVPFAAVIVTKLLRRPEMARGEAHALATQTGAYRRIRSTRILARITYIPLFAAAAFVIAFAPYAVGY